MWGGLMHRAIVKHDDKVLFYNNCFVHRISGFDAFKLSLLLLVPAIKNE